MERLTDKLPEREKAYLHEEFFQNEESYWRIRERLLPHYAGKWVAVRAGEVVASGDTVLDVLDRVRTLGGHPYIALVGDEHRQLMIRRTFAYDTTYQPFAVPRATARFSGQREDLSVESRERILGRDVLNQLRVTFDGPAGRTEID